MRPTGVGSTFASAAQGPQLLHGGFAACPASARRPQTRGGSPAADALGRGAQRMPIDRRHVPLFRDGLFAAANLKVRFASVPRLRRPLPQSIRDAFGRSAGQMRGQAQVELYPTTSRRAAVPDQPGINMNASFSTSQSTAATSNGPGRGCRVRTSPVGTGCPLRRALSACFREDLRTSGRQTLASHRQCRTAPERERADREGAATR